MAGPPQPVGKAHAWDIEHGTTLCSGQAAHVKPEQDFLTMPEVHRCPKCVALLATD